MAVLTCLGVIVLAAAVGATVGIPTGGIGFFVVAIATWTIAIPKAWKWAIQRFGDKS